MSELYHGSDHPFQVGDVIEPRPPRNVAYATPHIGTAIVFSHDTRRVYRVEPLDGEELPLLEMKHTGNEVHHEVLSAAGFRVVEVIETDKCQHVEDRDTCLACWAENRRDEDYPHDCAGALCQTCIQLAELLVEFDSPVTW